MRDTRIASIEVFRAIAILAVICIHTRPFFALRNDAEIYRFLALRIDHLARFAVPFFFITAGYFFGKKLNRGAPLGSTLTADLKKLGLIFITWSLMYAVVPRWIPVHAIRSRGWDFEFAGLVNAPLQAAIRKFQAAPLNFLLEGTWGPLWFLPALMLALIIVSILVFLKKEKLIVPLASVLFVIGLLTKAYVATPLGMSIPVRMNPRNGPFIATLFVALGWRFSKQTAPPLGKWAATTMIVGAIVLQEAEIYLLASYYRASPVFDCVLATLPFGVGVFLLALAEPRFAANTPLPMIGGLTLGIYVSHGLLLRFVGSHAGYFNPIVWHCVFPLLVFSAAALCVLVLRKCRFKYV